MKNTTPSNNKTFRKKQSDASNYMRYSGVGFQLIAAVMLGFGVGAFADYIFGFDIPLFKTLFSFGGVLLGLYIIVKEVLKP